jgi:hypothetical protein
MRPIRRALGRLSVAAVLAAATVFVAAAPAHASTSPTRPVTPDRWTRSVCQDISTWLKARGEAETRMVEALGGAGSAALSPKAAKARLTRAISQGADATDRFIKDVKAAGTPQVNNGKPVVSGYLQTLGDYGKAYKEARAALARAKTRDKQQFATTAQQVNSTLAGDLAAVGVDPVEELRAVPELAAGISASCGDVAAYLTAKIEAPCQAALNTARHLSDVDAQLEATSEEAPQGGALFDEEDRTMGQLRNDLGGCNVPGIPAPCRKPFETAQGLPDLWNQFIDSAVDSPQEQALIDELTRQFGVLRSDMQAMCH